MKTTIFYLKNGEKKQIIIHAETEQEAAERFKKMFPNAEMLNDDTSVKASSIEQPKKASNTAAKAEPTEEEKALAATVTNCKFYYNGIKPNNGDLIKCWYSGGKFGEPVKIHGKDYKDLPRDLFDVKNDSDSYTDYFCDDVATVPASHPLYKFVYYAFAKEKIRSNKKEIEYYQNIIDDRTSSVTKASQEVKEIYKSHIEKFKNEIAELEALENPGHPSISDFAAVAKMNLEAENARRAAEQEAEQKAREEMLVLKVEGRRTIAAAVEAFPIVEGEPLVNIEFSEHPAFYDLDNFAVSVSAAEMIFTALDNEKARENGGYYKTDFKIMYTENGEPCTYSGRYDLGDFDGGLINHIRSWGEWNKTHDQYGHEINLNFLTVEQARNINAGVAIVKLADWLNTFNKFIA